MPEKIYEAPAVIFETPLEIRAGSPPETDSTQNYNCISSKAANEAMRRGQTQAEAYIRAQNGSLNSVRSNAHRNPTDADIRKAREEGTEASRIFNNNQKTRRRNAR